MTEKRKAPRVVILGATSAIAEATARIYAQENAEIVLVGRSADRLSIVAADLRLRGAGRVEVAVHDLADAARSLDLCAEWISPLGGVDHVLVAYGILGEQSQAERDWAHAEQILQVNFLSTAAWILAAAAQLRTQRQGALVVLGSVAGDRGRRANFVYGAAKAGVATLVEGIAHGFADAGPRAVIVKPGPTITPMTEGMDRKGLLWSTPEQIARVVRAAADHGGPVVYAPWFWWPIMTIIRALPWPIFKRLNI